MNRENDVKLPEAKYEKSCAVVRLVGQVNNESIFALCDEIDLAIEYYNYRKIDIHIDSNGGAIVSLDYFISKLEKWRKKQNVIIGTLGLTMAGSAAAMILSLGDIGYRRAYLSSQLIYHDARIVTDGPEVWTKERMSHTNKNLAKTDERLLEKLTSHIYKIAEDNIEERVFHNIDYNYEDKNYEVVAKDKGCTIEREEIKRELVKLNSLDTLISAETAYKLFLIDFSQEKFELAGLEQRFKNDN